MNAVRSTLLGLALSLVALPALPDVLLIDEVASAAGKDVPVSGLSMDQVRARFGNPQAEMPPVSANRGPHQPPITRWDYSDYSVFFERDRVVHSVAHRSAN